MELKTENNNENIYYVKSNNSSDEYNSEESSVEEYSDNEENNEEIKNFILNQMKNDKNKIKELEIKLQIKQEETKQRISTLEQNMSEIKSLLQDIVLNTRKE